MDTLRRELDELILEVAPPLIDLAQLERLVTEDERQVFDGECAVRRLPAGERPTGLNLYF